MLHWKKHVGHIVINKAFWQPFGVAIVVLMSRLLLVHWDNFFRWISKIVWLFFVLTTF